MHWGDTVARQVAAYGELVVGIDPVLEYAPRAFEVDSDCKSEWVHSYVDFVLAAITGHVGFVKFQSAFFEAYGASGIHALAQGIAQAKKQGLAVILDAKRGDIGSTAAAYSRAYLTPLAAGGTSDLEVDCMTINPFLGPDTLEPFVDCARKHGKGLFILVKTSNPGAGWLQDAIVDKRTVSDRVAELIREWANETRGTSGLSAVGAVVGATFPGDGQRLRTIMPDSVFLAPGIGPQGGVATEIQSLRRTQGDGVVVPVSRGITKIDDRSLSLDAYGEIIQQRIANLRTTLR